MSSSDGHKRIFTVSPEYQDYDIQLTKGWARNAIESSEYMPEISGAVFALVSEFRAITYTASLPFTMVTALQSFYASLSKTKLGETGTEKVVGALLKRVVHEVNGLSESQFDELQRLASSVKCEMVEIGEKSVQAFPLEMCWQEISKGYQFNMSLWGSQRVSFVAIYNNYESFLTHCVKIGLGRVKYRKKGAQKFGEHIESSFGKETRDLCWDCEAVEIPRLIRHALSHAAGKETDEIKDRNLDGIIENGEVQPRAHHVKALIRTVEKAVLVLIESVRKRSQNH